MTFKPSWQNGAGNSDVRNLGKPTCLQEAYLQILRRTALPQGDRQGHMLDLQNHVYHPERCTEKGYSRRPFCRGPDVSAEN